MRVSILGGLIILKENLVSQRAIAQRLGFAEIASLN
jgi:hypothetical protein